MKAEEISVLKIPYSENISELLKTHRIVHPAHSNFVFAIPLKDIDVQEQAASIPIRQRNQSATPPQPTKKKPE